MRQDEERLPINDRNIFAKIMKKIEYEKKPFRIIFSVYLIIAIVFLILAFTVKDEYNNYCIACFGWLFTSIFFLGMIRRARIPPSSFSFGSNGVKSLFYYLNKPKGYLISCWIAFGFLTVSFVVSLFSLFLALM